MHRLTRSMCNLLEQGESFVLATVLSQAGSTPRTAGARMVVRSKGSILGTVGGGQVEAEIIQAAKGVFEAARGRIRVFHLQGSLGHGVDMICGGRMEILLAYIEATARNLGFFQTLQRALQERRRCLLVTALGSPEEGPGQTRLSLLGEDSVEGDFPFPAAWLAVLKEQAAGQRGPVIAFAQDQRFLVEPCAVPPAVFLFGAGHVAQQVAALTPRVGFRTVVLDDRPEYANRERFPGAGEIIVLSSFENAFQGLEMQADSYVVIVTRGHSHDKTVLAQALRTLAGYIGMMGSKRKRDTLYEALMQEGFRPEDLQRVHCPIGLKIGAETPEEIAVSIVAELILVRSEAQLQ
jgi:xanthine dehydrogenase accessory factor